MDSNAGDATVEARLEQRGSVVGQLHGLLGGAD